MNSRLRVLGSTSLGGECYAFFLYFCVFTVFFWGIWDSGGGGIFLRYVELTLDTATVSPNEIFLFLCICILTVCQFGVSTLSLNLTCGR